MGEHSVIIKTPCVKGIPAGIGCESLTGQILIWALQGSGLLFFALLVLSPRGSQNPPALTRKNAFDQILQPG